MMQIIKIRFAVPQDKLYRQSIRSVVVATSLMTAGYSLAAPIDVGNPDINLRWDNTVKYSAGMRVGGQDDKLSQNAPPPAGGGAGPAALNGNDGDLNFKRGSLTSNRFDLLSEMDVTYRNDFGARVSAAAGMTTSITTITTTTRRGPTTRCRCRTTNLPMTRAIWKAARLSFWTRSSSVARTSAQPA